MGYGSETQVQCHLDSEFMLLSIPDSKKTFQVNGDKMTPGISVSNSEVGLSMITLIEPPLIAVMEPVQKIQK
jgi:hypothetical protein